METVGNRRRPSGGTRVRQLGVTVVGVILDIVVISEQRRRGAGAGRADVPAIAHIKGRVEQAG